MARRVLIAGASDGGIGGAIARRIAWDCARAGEPLSIVLSATGADPDLHVLSADLRRMVVSDPPGGGVLIITGDLAEPSFPGMLAADAAAYCGGLDLVVFAAGRSQSGTLAELPREDWDGAMDVHVRAAWLLARAVVPWLTGARGSFIAIGSVSGTVPHAGRGAYPVAKAALIAMCAQLAAEWAGTGVRANVVSPGLVSTRRRPKAWAPQVVPLGRAATPDDIAGVVAWLAGPDAAYVTGQNIVADGGLAGAGLGEVLHG